MHLHQIFYEAVDNTALQPTPSRFRFTVAIQCMVVQFDDFLGMPVLNYFAKVSSSAGLN